MNAWAHLPNAAHIDRVLAHSAAHPARWDAAWGAAWGAARDAAWGAARGAARGACAALVAWDDGAHVLLMPVDAIKTLAACGHRPAILLLPAVKAMNEEPI